jgi:hypothetical protein
VLALAEVAAVVLVPQRQPVLAEQVLAQPPHRQSGQPPN